MRNVKTYLLAFAIAGLAAASLQAQTGPRVLEGRMVGGGSVITDENDLWVPAGTRLTHGFELHCDSLEQPNNLDVQVHLPNGDWGRFHLEQLTFAWCWNSGSANTRRPPAGFDSYIGAGTGRFNGEGGYCADWHFSDEGEPGTADRVRSMRIWRPLNGNCAFEDGPFLFSIYLAPGHALTFGNHVALKK